MNSAFDCRDRTGEFFSTIQQIQKAQNQLHNGVDDISTLADATSHRPLPKSSAFGVSSSSSSSSAAGFHNEFDERPDPSRAQQPKQQSQFTQAAQHIGRSIHSVTEKLEKLGKLSKQRSLFNDPASTINELTSVIKTDISTLHNELAVLHEWTSSRRSDAADGAPLSVHAARNSTAIVDSLKLQLMSTTKNFQEVLQLRTNNLKEQNQRRRQFETSGSSGSSTGGGATGNAAVRKRAGNPFDALMSEAASHKRPIIADDNEATSPDDVPFGGGGLHDQLLIAPPTTAQTDDYLTSRTEAVESIESTIVELGELYKKLVTVVGMQEEITLRIDANMDAALDNMDKGHQELVNWYDRVSGSRWLILKVFAIILAFIIFFMLFVA